MALSWRYTLSFAWSRLRGGSAVIYTIDAVPRSPLWSIPARLYLGSRTHRQFDRAFRDIASYLEGEVEAPYPQTQAQRQLSGRTGARLRGVVEALEKTGFDRNMGDQLVQYVGSATDEACYRIKPYALADAWGEDRETVLRLCLHATRLGLLELTWDVICPLCRGEKDRVSSLSDLRREAHCSSCNIRFDANFDRSVEVTFRPSERIRKLEVASYCVGGPQNTPHILMQQSVAPHSSVSLHMDLAGGVYRLRGPRMATSGLVEVDPSHAASESVSISCSRDDLSPAAVQIAPGRSLLCLHNSGDEEQLLILEKMEWPDDAATAARVSALQDFRDLFSSEVLSPEEGFEVRYLTVMFTDLRSSTAMYRERGDAPAYALVRDHFQVLRDAIAKHHGAVVKTIGDAVMAVFCEPGDAVATGLDIHRAFESGPARHLDLVLKVGLHAGPCIVVNLNGRLDYFGTTVNAAARLEGQSLGGDVVFSSDLMEDPMVRDVVTAPDIRIERGAVELKGFEGPFNICRASLETPSGRSVA